MKSEAPPKLGPVRNRDAASFSALGAKLDPHGALGVFTSLATDTGWFKYGNTDAEALRVASELVELGVRPDDEEAQ